MREEPIEGDDRLRSRDPMPPNASVVRASSALPEGLGTRVDHGG